MAYIIKDGKAIATVNTDLKNGTCVNRERNLVDAKSGKISRAKKWNNHLIEASAVPLNHDNDTEFLIIL